jgi:ABC-2 type transport system ATP-binding protein
LLLPQGPIIDDNLVMKNNLAISCNGLNKNFISYKKLPGITGTVKSFFSRNSIKKSAIENFTLEIKKGEIVALLGPNGAGKTTLMKMFTGIIVPTDGELSVLGYTPADRHKEFRKKIALVMGQKSQLWWDIPAMDSFILLQKYYEIPEQQFRARLNQLTKLLDVERLLHVHLRKLSLGERMKMELIASLLHSPEIIFLDEPTIGLDLIAQEKIREFIKSYHQEHQCTIIVTSHYMADVEALCSRLILVLDGKKSFDGPLAQFSNILGSDKVVSFTFNTAQETDNLFWKNLDASWSKQNTQVELRLAESRVREIAGLILKDFSVTDFQTQKMPIERVMKTLLNNPKFLQDHQT